MVRERCCSSWSAYVGLGKMWFSSLLPHRLPLRPPAGLLSLYLQAFRCLTPHIKINKVPKYFLCWRFGGNCWCTLCSLSEESDEEYFILSQGCCMWSGSEALQGIFQRKLFTFIGNKISWKCRPQESRSFWLKLGDLLVSEVSPLISRWKLVSAQLQWRPQGD